MAMLRHCCPLERELYAKDEIASNWGNTYTFNLLCIQKVPYRGDICVQLVQAEAL